MVLHRTTHPQSHRSPSRLQNYCEEERKTRKRKRKPEPEPGAPTEQDEPVPAHLSDGHTVEGRGHVEPSTSSPSSPAEAPSPPELLAPPALSHQHVHTETFKPTLRRP